MDLSLLFTGDLVLLDLQFLFSSFAVFKKNRNNRVLLLSSLLASQNGQQGLVLTLEDTGIQADLGLQIEVYGDDRPFLGLY